MSTPLTAVSKLEFKYDIRGFTHRINMYMAYNNILGQHQMNDRDGITTVLWTVGAQYIWDLLRVLYTTMDLTVGAQLSLFDRSGLFWNLVDVAQLTGVGTLGSGVAVAHQATWVLRDTAFKKLRFVVLETLAAYVGHSQDGTTLGTPFNNVTGSLSGGDVSANAPYRWMKSRGNRFLAATGVVAGLTFDVNDKLKRRRGLA